MSDRFSMKEVLKSKFGEPEKNLSASKATKRSDRKVKSNDSSRYQVKIVDGVKYMVLK